MDKEEREKLLKEARKAEKEAEDKQGEAEAKRRLVKKEEAKEKTTDTTGFNPGDLLKAPIEPPQVAVAKPPKNRQLGVMAIGLGIALFGLLLALMFQSPFAVLLMVIGGLIIAVGVFIRF